MPRFHKRARESRESLLPFSLLSLCFPSVPFLPSLSLRLKCVPLRHPLLRCTDHGRWTGCLHASRQRCFHDSECHFAFRSELMTNASPRLKVERRKNRVCNLSNFDLKASRNSLVTVQRDSVRAGLALTLLEPLDINAASRFAIQFVWSDSSEPIPGPLRPGTVYVQMCDWFKCILRFSLLRFLIKWGAKVWLCQKASNWIGRTFICSAVLKECLFSPSHRISPFIFHIIFMRVVDVSGAICRGLQVKILKLGREFLFHRISCEQVNCFYV